MEPPTTSPTPEDLNDESVRRPLRILHREENPRDRELVQAVLRDAGLVCEFIYAANDAGFHDALARDDLDLILSDFTLSGPEAITGCKQPREQPPQEGEMEALGRLAGGIAHDFNNLLTVINGYATLALGHGDVPDQFLHPLQQIYSAGERAADLARRLLVFARQAEMRLTPIDLNSALRAATTMLGGLVGERIRLELALSPRLPLVEADASMIEQVLTNLAVNARDAMPAGGRLTFRTDLVEFDETPARHHDRRRPGTFVRLSVGDTGTGIPPDVLPRIFEPFFTTKKTGPGAGLGLAMIFGILADHRGWVEVESEPGQGSTFHLFLPAAPAGSTLAPHSPDASPDRAPTMDGNETILLVEDEAPVREFTRAVLRHHGYRVLQATSGNDALETWKWHSSRISLLLTDRVLPGQLDGLELARRLQAEKPSLKVLCTSGYSRDLPDHRDPASRAIRFLQKPYQPALLARTIRDCLDAPEPSPLPPSAP
ncbi:MAG: response regulator [Burkholderiales bacterium]|nr:response regulator [Opitutaceae bacterium]